MGWPFKGKALRKTAAGEGKPSETPAEGALPSWTSSVALHLIFIALLGLLAYSNTFNVPFQFDDVDYIVENPIIKDFGYFTDPSKAATLDADEVNVFRTRKTRTVAFLTFFANYKLHGLKVRGYHAVNLSIHIVNAMLIYSLLILTFRTPALEASVLRGNSRYIALFSALLFVIHPLQTQAVTYICQRFTSFAAMFYLFSLVSYAKWRLAHHSSRGRQAAFYILSLASSVLAMKTKENAFTLPPALALYDLMFFGASIKKRLLYFSPFILTMLVIPFGLIAPDSPLSEAINGATRTQELIPRRDYLLTQFRVIVTYLRLLIFPVNQNLDYDFPVYGSFLEPNVFLSFFFLALIVMLGFYLLKRGRRLAAFGVFWFFLTLSVESSAISLEDVIFEHRLYLPSVGAFMTIATGAFLITRRLKSKNAMALAVSIFILITLVFSYATYARNGIWGSETGLWEDVVKKSPKKARGYFCLGNAYQTEGLIDKAIEHFQIALRLKPDYIEVYNNLGSAFETAGSVDKAIEHFQVALRLKPDYAIAHNNLGNVYLTKGLIDKAIEHFRIALRLKPDFAVAHNNLGNAYLTEGSVDKAIAHLQSALKLNPGYAEGHYNLGIAYRAKGLSDKTIKHLEIALRLKPDYADAHTNLGVVYKAEGLIDKAIEHFRIALRLKPVYAVAHNNLGNAYRAKGLPDKAIEHLEIALRLKPDYADAHNNLGIAYISKGLFEEAIKCFRTALRLSPDSADIHFNLGRAYLEKGLVEPARSEIEAALRINPDFHKARQALDRIGKTRQ